MSYNVIIIDDEPLAINVVKSYVEQFDELKLLKTFKNALNAASYLQENTVDIIFLDINMPVLNGLEFLESLTVKPFVVITTAHEEYALKGFEYQAIGYLVKPIPFASFVKVVNRILGLLNLKSAEPVELACRPSIFVKVSKKKMQKIYLEDIQVIESMKDYIRIKTSIGNFIAHQSLGSFTDELPSNAFIRIHRSFTIAIDKIESIESNQLQIDGVKYVIGRQYLNEVRQQLLN
ncbi:MAG: hypothetical protein RLZZ241_292 [Bacteroidota bacterium]|jgi:DNA-binding LytR/AlgR family response regulator